jgi:hypothetical protein
MKIIGLKARLALVFSLVVLAGGAAVAQAPSVGAPTSLNTAFVKLFGTAGAFTAKVETQVFDTSQKETVRMPMDFAVLEGKARIEVNLAQMQAKDLPASTIAGLKQAGMDRVISIFRPDKNATYVLYPSIQSYTIIPLAKGEAEVSGKSLKLGKTALGKETIDGHACVKNKVVVKSDEWPVFEAVTWNAADLKDFPLQIELKKKQSTVRMRYTQVRFAKLDAQQFDLPASYSPMK